MTRRIGLACLLTVLACAPARADEPRPVHVVVWDEQQPEQKAAYDHFLGNAIAESLTRQPGLVVKSVRLDDPDQGLPPAVLDECDVLIWWGHLRHKDVSQETVTRVLDRIKAGKMDLIALHSAHWSRPFVEAMHSRSVFDAVEKLADEKIVEDRMELVVPPELTAPEPRSDLTPKLTVKLVDGKAVARLVLPICAFPAYRADGKPSHASVLKPDHPAVSGVPARFDIAATEMYDEPFHVPEPDAVILEETWDGGERFRSLCVWKVGEGRVVYFRPGHEIYPVYKQAEPLKILANTARWLGGEP